MSLVCTQVVINANYHSKLFEHVNKSRFLINLQQLRSRKYQRTISTRSFSPLMRQNTQLGKDGRVFPCRRNRLEAKVGSNYSNELGTNTAIVLFLVNPQYCFLLNWSSKEPSCDTLLTGAGPGYFFFLCLRLSEWE